MSEYGVRSFVTIIDNSEIEHSLPFNSASLHSRPILSCGLQSSKPNAVNPTISLLHTSASKTFLTRLLGPAPHVIHNSAFTFSLSTIKKNGQSRLPTPTRLEDPYPHHRRAARANSFCKKIAFNKNILHHRRNVNLRRNVSFRRRAIRIPLSLYLTRERKSRQRKRGVYQRVYQRSMSSISSIGIMLMNILQQSTDVM